MVGHLEQLDALHPLGCCHEPFYIRRSHAVQPLGVRVAVQALRPPLQLRLGHRLLVEDPGSVHGGGGVCGVRAPNLHHAPSLPHVVGLRRPRGLIRIHSGADLRGGILQLLSALGVREDLNLTHAPAVVQAVRVGEPEVGVLGVEPVLGVGHHTACTGGATGGGDVALAALAGGRGADLLSAHSRVVATTVGRSTLQHILGPHKIRIHRREVHLEGPVPAGHHPLLTGRRGRVQEGHYGGRRPIKRVPEQVQVRGRRRRPHHKLEGPGRRRCAHGIESLDTHHVSGPFVPELGVHGSGPEAAAQLHGHSEPGVGEHLQGVDHSHHHLRRLLAQGKQLHAGRSGGIAENCPAILPFVGVDDRLRPVTGHQGLGHEVGREQGGGRGLRVVYVGQGG
mmetsp:Transcript_102580/g.235344  ORF Transcript_102580/g.235344 Transcript_102580/m.235344 type:complete len:394 (-) Transcript_102580:637-1818(-)